MKDVKVKITQRLDQAVVAQIPKISRSYAARLIESGKVSVNDQVIQKAAFKVRDNDKLKIDFDPLQLNSLQAIDIPILYEDEDCIVINKPVGLLTHSKGAFNPEPTVASWLKRKVKIDLGDERGGIVHRLDRATSGVMICAKTLEAQNWLQKQFSQRKVIKIYNAVVSGQMPHDHAIIDMPIIRNPKKPQFFHVSSKGKSAVTEYWVEDKSPTKNLVKLQPRTGRTHQLRVHLSTIGHPIIGDTFYGGQEADRLFLHASELELTLPSRLRKKFSIPLPAQFRDLVKS